MFKPLKLFWRLYSVHHAFLVILFFLYQRYVLNANLIVLDVIRTFLLYVYNVILHIHYQIKNVFLVLICIAQNVNYQFICVTNVYKVITMIEIKINAKNANKAVNNVDILMTVFNVFKDMD